MQKQRQCSFNVEGEFTRHFLTSRCRGLLQDLRTHQSQRRLRTTWFAILCCRKFSWFLTTGGWENGEEANYEDEISPRNLTAGTSWGYKAG